MKKKYLEKMILLRPFRRESSSIPPVWLMRQAGRYLPEYRELRSQRASLWDLILDPPSAAEITLQPIRRFDLDAAILFSDILIIPHLLGQKVRFLENEGPCLAPLNLEEPAGGLSLERIASRFEPITQTLSLVRRSLAPEKALIGFAGGPWTTLAYMLEGRTSKDFLVAKRIAFSHPTKFQELLAVVTDAIICCLRMQILAGADVLQIFESWAGVVPSTHYKAWIEDPTALIVRSIKTDFPHIPIMGFPRGLGTLSARYVEKTGVDGLSLDIGYSLIEASKLPCVLQGNLDPGILLEGGKILKESVTKICTTLRERPFIFNLGHGVLRETPVEHVAQLVDIVRKFDA